jgi:uncharacterized protein (DUF433 family)
MVRFHLAWRASQVIAAIVSRTSMSLLDRITQASPGIGVPCFRNTSVTVPTVLSLLASGRSAAEIVAAHPGLENDDVSAAIEFVKSVLRARDNATRAVSRLGVSRGTLTALLKRVPIPRPSPPPR